MINILVDGVIAIILTVLIMMSVVLVGRVVSKFDIFLIEKMSSVSGKKLARFIINRVMIAGVVFHELSHALFAKLTGARVTKIKFLVLFSKDTLGSVTFTPVGNKAQQSIQLCLASCAPVLMAFIAVPLFVILAVFVDIGFVWRVLFAYLAISVLCHASMSSADLNLYKTGARYVGPMLCLFVFAVIGLFF